MKPQWQQVSKVHGISHFLFDLCRICFSTAALYYSKLAYEQSHTMLWPAAAHLHCVERNTISEQST